MPDILVTEAVTGTEMDALKRAFDVTYQPEAWKSPEKLFALVPNFKAIIVRNQTPVTAELIAAAGKNLQVIGRAGVGLDNVDAKAASNAGIVLVYAPEQNSVSVAELTLGLMLSLARAIPAADRSTKAGQWDRRRFVGVELQNKTLGVVGLGRIGFLTAMRARAFGMNILAHDEYINPDSFTVSESRARLTTLDDLLANSDFISCHVPETPQTLNLFNYTRFSQMKPTAFFLNAARGKVVDEPGLIRALKDKKIAGAALDVRATEPPQKDELQEMDNVILMPHIAAFTNEAQERVVACVCKDVSSILSGQPAKNFFNFARPKKTNG
jgi:D-3-phosphoglycerate dehydrogenase / 2-oxoglutarate reductase